MMEAAMLLSQSVFVFVMRKICLLVLPLLLLDQLTKWLMAGKSFEVMGDFFRLHYSENFGGGFGLFQGFGPFLIIIAMVAIVVIFLLYLREESRILRWAYMLIIAGASGNLIDRIFLGYVRDFINVGWWPNFNFADSYITIAVALLVVDFYLSRKKN